MLLRKDGRSPTRGQLAAQFGVQGKLARLSDQWRVAVARNPSHHQGVSKVEEMEAELRKLSQPELRQIREWLDDIIEDDLQFTAEFERSIEQAERDMASGKRARVREPEGS